MTERTDQASFLMENYARLPVAFARGQGARLWDTEGKEYIDLIAGIAVCALGHAHPGVAEALCEQAKKLVHTSNLFRIPPQEELARLLAERSFADRVFFGNSGAEANEAALKLARRWASENKNGAYEIIAARGSFHGRTMFALSVTGQEKFHQGFHPLVPGVVFVPYNDPEAIERAISDKTAAVLLEPIQGESGVRVPDDDYLARVREICTRHEALLILDEVQTGMGRTGKLFAYEHAGVEPDIMTLAKALGNGFPIGAMLAREEVAAAFKPGSHASTFGGNYLAAAAGIAVMKEMTEDFLARVREKGEALKKRLEEMAASHGCVKEVRGRGLLLGIQLDRPGKPAVDFCLQRGVLINCAGESVLRIAPPLVIEERDLEEALPVLEEALSMLDKNPEGETKAEKR